MSDVQSALGGAVFDGLARVTEMGPRGMITLRGDFETPGFAAALQMATGLTMPKVRGVSTRGAMALCWMSPDEALLLCPYADAPELATRLASALSGMHALAVNVSDARAVFQVQGVRMRDVIAKLAPVDMAPEAFAPGDFRRTRFSQVAAAFRLTDETTAEIYCFRSVAQYMMDLLSVAADPESAVDYFSA